MKPGWTEVSLGELLQPASRRLAGRGSFPILSMTMRDGLVDQESKFKKRVASADTASYKVVSRGQLVVGFPIDEGVLAFQDLYDAAIVSPAYGIWDVRKPESTWRPYLQRFLRSSAALAYYAAKLRGTTARRRSLPNGVFSEMKVPMPPLEEQQRIAAILDKADDLLAKRRAALAHLDSLTPAIFIDLFGDPTKNERSWEVHSLGDLAMSATYGTAEKASPAGAVPVLRMGNLTVGGELDTADLKYVQAAEEKYLLRPGDVLFNRTNSPDLVGKTAVFRLDGLWAYAGYLIRLRLTEALRPEYLGAYMNLPTTKQQLRSMCKTIVGMANINATEVQRMRLPVPPLEAQSRFEAAVISARQARSSVQAGRTATADLAASLQARAFRGDL